MADARLAAHLIELGATTEQVAAIELDGDLIGLAGDLQLTDGLDLTFDQLVDEVAADVGRRPGDVRAIYGQLGLRVDEIAGFGPGDIEFVGLVLGDDTGMVDEVAPQLLRVAGTVVGRLCEAIVAAYVQDVESTDDADADLVELADRNHLASALAMAFGGHLPTVFRHHMLAAVRRQRAAQADVAHREVVRMAVGFVDLVGFTPRSGELSPADLIAAIDGFEQSAFEIANRHGGRIVKSIGDEVMIAGPEPAIVAAIALDLIDENAEDPSIAPRGGVSAGDVLFRLGDYYGPVVNLAARLVTEAVPGELLTDLDDFGAADLAVRPGGRRMLKGFADPVTVWAVERSG